MDLEKFERIRAIAEENEGKSIDEIRVIAEESERTFEITAYPSFGFPSFPIHWGSRRKQNPTAKLVHNSAGGNTYRKPKQAK